MAKYFTDSKHKYLPMLMVISETFFQALSPGDQKLVSEAGLQSALHARKIYSHEIEEKTQKAQAGGAVVGKLNPGADRIFKKPWSRFIRNTGAGSPEARISWRPFRKENSDPEEDP